MPDNLIRMQGPANCGGLTYDGISYVADEDGVIEVPGTVIGAATEHGFIAAPEKLKMKLEKATAKAAEKAPDKADKA